MSKESIPDVQVAMILSSLKKPLFMAVILFPLTISAAADDLFLTAESSHTKRQQNDIVFLQTTSIKAQIFSYIAARTPNLKKSASFMPKREYRTTKKIAVVPVEWFELAGGL